MKGIELMAKLMDMEFILIMKELFMKVSEKMINNMVLGSNLDPMVQNMKEIMSLE